MWKKWYRHQYIKESFVYIGAVVLCLIILTWVLQLWKADFSVPFGYRGDTILMSFLFKGTIENGGYLSNPSLGAPFGLVYYDYPLADSSSFLLVKLLALIVPDHAVILNLFYILTFPLTTLSALLVFRSFRISIESSIVGSLLFTFLPYHFFRGEAHLFLAAYYGVPLTVMVTLWMYTSSPFLFQCFSRKQEAPKSRRDIFRSVASFVICLFVGSGAIYYAFFACFFFLIAGISASFQRKRIIHFLQSGILIFLICLSIFVNILPNILYTRTYGKNPEVAARSFGEAEVYGLKVIQMLLPIQGHRIQQLAEKASSYIRTAPLVNENSVAALGGIVSIGFLCLIGWLLYGFNFHGKTRIIKENELFDRLSIFTVFAVLLGSIGGFGALFAFLISPKIRAYNRISVYIAFFSLFGLCTLSDRFARNYVRTRKAKLFFRGGLCILLLLGILDQTTPRFIPDYAGLKAAYTRDADFIAKIEVSVPENSMIFQLPYHPYPEAGWQNQLYDYDHFRGYLHSKRLKWSYGTMKGRYGDLWQKTIIKKPIREFVDALSFAGFSGIYLDRKGYDDGGAEIESQLSTLLNSTAITNEEQNLLFFDLTDYIAVLRRTLGEEQWERERAHIFDEKRKTEQISLSWRKGFSPLERTADDSWRWCSSTGELELINRSPHAQVMTFEMSFMTGYEDFSKLIIESDLFSASEHLKVNAQGTTFSKNVEIPSGKHLVTFVSDAPRVNAPGDPRDLVFRVNNFQLSYSN